MIRTYWTLEDAIAAENKGVARIAQGYAWNAVAGKYASEARPDFPGVSGSGAIISDFLDYANWLKV